MAELKPERAQGALGVIEAYARAGDAAHRDAEVARLRALMEGGTLPMNLRFVREQFTAGDHGVTVSEYPYLTASRSRYQFDVLDAQQKFVQRLELVSREGEQATFRKQHPREAAAGVRQFTLTSRRFAPQPDPAETNVRVYARGEPAYVQVVAD